MKKVFFVLFFALLIAPNTSYGKATICEFSFHTNNIRQDCLMVLNDLSSYGNNYMRVAYTVNGNYIVINQQLRVEQQQLADGNAYITASGYNVRFITNSFGQTYFPDKLSAIINGFGVIEQPKIGDARNAMMPVSSFRDVSNVTLENNYLKRFFVDGETELYSLSTNSYGNQLQLQSPRPNSIQNNTSIEFYNNTGSEINACYAYYNNNDRCWTSVGWYIVPAYSYKTIDIGNYSGNVYIRGRQGLATEWGSGDGQFCVDATQAFNIKFADTKDCWSKKKFSKFYVVSGTNKWTFN